MAYEPRYAISNKYKVILGAQFHILALKALVKNHQTNIFESEDSSHASDTDRDEEALATYYDDTKCDPYRSDLVFLFRFSSEFS